VNPSPNSKDSEQHPAIGSCVYCGCSDAREPMVHHYLADGTAVRVACTSITACTARQDAQAAALTRTSMTPAGRAAGKWVA
jgi:hypothetical protein